MTTGKKFARRTSDHGMEQILDHRTRTLLNAVASAPRGRQLNVWIKALHKAK
jgi:hypothetical protein